MIVCDFDIKRSIVVVGPLETDTPLLVDADAELSLTVAPSASKRLLGNNINPFRDTAALKTAIRFFACCSNA